MNKLIASVDIHTDVRAALQSEPVRHFDEATILALAENQEVWAAGVNYFRSRNARMEEPRDAGGGTFTIGFTLPNGPELLFRASGRRVVGPKRPV